MLKWLNTLLRYNSALLMLLFINCIGTDFIDDTELERIVIENPISTLKIGEQHQFIASYYNKFGEQSSVPIEWFSSDESIATVNNGLVTAISKGNVLLFVSANDATENVFLEIGDETSTGSDERVASLQTVSSYPMSGTATLMQVGNKLVLNLSNDYSTTSDLPGLYVYLSNSTSSVVGALEIGPVTAFSGAHSYEVPGSPGLHDYDLVLFYCKPFSVPVGFGSLTP